MPPTLRRAHALALTAALVVPACATRRYDVDVRFTTAAVDRRLARGQADVITGKPVRADATNLYVNAGGSEEAIPLADIATLDQGRARREGQWGIAFALGGAVLAVAGALYFECGSGDFVVKCAFDSKTNFWAGMSVVGGVALAGAGIGAIVMSRGDQAHNDELMRSAGGRTSAWWIAPTPVAAAGGVAPGVGFGVRY